MRVRQSSFGKSGTTSCDLGDEVAVACSWVMMIADGLPSGGAVVVLFSPSRRDKDSSICHSSCRDIHEIMLLLLLSFASAE